MYSALDQRAIILRAIYFKDMNESFDIRFPSDVPEITSFPQFTYTKDAITVIIYITKVSMIRLGDVFLAHPL